MFDPIDAARAAAEAARQAALAAARRAAEAARRQATEQARKQAEQSAAKQAPAEAAAAKTLAKDAPVRRNGTGDLQVAAAAIRRGDAAALPWAKEVPAEPPKAKDLILGGGLFGLAIKQTIDGMVQRDREKNAEFVRSVGPKLSEAGAAAIAKLSEDGKLSAVDDKGHTVRDTVGELVAKGAAPEVLETVLAQAADPEAGIVQTKDATCVAATAQKALAAENPAEYARISAELLTGGQAKLPNGETMKVSEQNRKAIETEGLEGPDRVNALFQAAAMDYANGEASYDYATDRSHLETEQMSSTTSGLSATEAKALNQVLLESPTFDPDKLGRDVDRRIDQQRDLPQDEKATVYEMYADNIDAQLEAAKGSGAGGMFLVIHGGSETLKGPDGKPLPMGLDAQVNYFHSVFVKGRDAAGDYEVIDALGETRKWNPEELARAIATEAQSVGELSGETTGYTGSRTVASSGGRRRGS